MSKHRGRDARHAEAVPMVERFERWLDTPAVVARRQQGWRLTQDERQQIADAVAAGQVQQVTGSGLLDASRYRWRAGMLVVKPGR